MSWKKPFANTRTSGSGYTNAGRNIILNCTPSINCDASDAKRENNGASKRMIRVEKDDGVNFRADKWLKKMKKYFKKIPVTACYPQIELFLSGYTEFYA